MKIIEKSAGLSDRQVFNIAHGNAVEKMSDHDGRVIDIVEYVLYTDTDTKTGTEKELLAVATNDGDIIGTNSATVITTFRAMVEQFGMPLLSVEIKGGISKNGRKFFDLSFVG